MKQLFKYMGVGLLLAGPVGAADVVSNAMSGICYPTLAAGVAAAANGDTLVMIADHVLPETLVISDRVISIVSDGTKRTITASTNCVYDMVEVSGLTTILTLGIAGAGDDADPKLVFNGGGEQGVTHLFDMFYVDLAELNLHPGVVLESLSSQDVGGIYNYGGLVRMYGGRIENNAAPYGAGFFNNQGDFLLYGGSITGNWAVAGGAIYNQAAIRTQEGYIIGYGGLLEMTGGTIGNNRADGAGGGVFNVGRFVFSGGNIVGNTAPEGGGIYHYNGSDFGLNMSGSAWVASNTAAKGSGIYYNNDEYTWLTLGGGARVAPPNDIYYAAGSSAIWLSEALTGPGLAAQITPFAYNTNAYVLGALTDDDLWLVTNYYGKFSVTPDSTDSNSVPWYVGAHGRLSRDNPAWIPATILSIASSETHVEWGVEPAYQAWDGIVELATNLVGQAWNFQPLPTNAYSVTDGRVVVPRDRPLGVYRLRTGGGSP